MNTFEWPLDWSSDTSLTVLIILYSNILILFNQKKSSIDKQQFEFCYDWSPRHNENAIERQKWSSLWNYLNVNYLRIFVKTPILDV